MSARTRKVQIVDRRCIDLVEIGGWKSRKGRSHSSPVAAKVSAAPSRWRTARRALRLQNIGLSDHDEPFAAIIRCTSDAGKVDKRTRSKWSRVLRYALEHKSHAEPLDQFIKDRGGINACASRFARCLGRRGAVAS